MDSQAINHRPSSVLRPPSSVIWRLRATFAGNLPPRTYITPDIRFANPGWNSEEFNRQIEQIEFFLPTGHKILMRGMEAYNFFAEATQLMARNGGASRIEAFWLCGKLPSSTTHGSSPFAPRSSCFIKGCNQRRTTHQERQHEIEMWRIGNGQVVRQRKPWGQEWGGTATRGWKIGLVGDAPVSTLLRTE